MAFFADRRTLRSVALSTTTLVALAAAPVIAQDTLTWDAGNGGAGTPAGADGDWVEGGGTTLWQDEPNNQADEDFADGDNARFEGPDGYTVEVAGDVDVNNINIRANDVEIANNAGAETLSIGGTVRVGNGRTGAEISADVDTGLETVGGGDLAISGEVTGTVTSGSNGTTTITNQVGALDSNAGTTVVAAGGDVQGATTVDNSEVNVNGGTLTGAATVNAGGTLDIDNGTTAAVTNNGGTVEIDGGTVASLTNTTGNTTMGGGTITGTTDIDAGNFTFNGGTLGDVDNASTFIISDSETVGGSFTNTGTIDATGATGDVTLTTSGFTSSGDVDSNGTDTVTIASGTIVLNAGATFDGANDLGQNVLLDGAITNNADLDVTGAITLTGALTNTNRLDVSAAITGGGNAITNDGGRLNIDTGGSIAGAGTVTNQNAGRVTIDAGTSVGATSVVNDGTGSAANATLIVVDGTLTAATVTNSNGARLRVRDNGGTQDGSISGTVTNTANLDIEGGTVGGIDNNTGGDVDVTGGGVVTGTVTNAAAFDINTGTLRVDGGTANSGTGDFTNENNGVLTIDSGATLQATLDNEVGATANVSGDVDGAVTNDGGTVALTSGSLGSLDNNTVTTGMVTTRGTVTSTGTSTVDANVTNAGDLSVNGGTLTVTNNSYVNEAGGVTTVADGATLDTDITNETDGTLIGTLNVSGDVDGAVTNNGGAVNLTGAAPGLQASIGSLDNNNFVSGGTTTRGTFNSTTVNAGDTNVIDGPVTNAGDFTVTSGTLNVTNDSFTNEAGGVATIASGAALDANVINQSTGDLNINGTLTGTLNNQSGGVTDIASTGRVTEAVTNAGTLNVAGGRVQSLTNTGDANFTNGGTIDAASTNTGTLDVDAGTLTVTAGGLATNAGGVTTVDGGAILSGTTSTAGTGVLTNNGTLTGALTNGGTANLNGTLTGNLTNAGTANLNGGSATTGTVNSTGILNVGNAAGGTATVTGNVTSSGTLNVVGDGTGSTALAVTGSGTLSGTQTATSGVSGGNVLVDAVSFTAGANGTLTFGLAAPVNGILDNQIISTAAGGNNLNYIIDPTNLPDAGLLSYFTESDGTNQRIRSQTSASVASVAATVGLTQTLVDTVVNRPTSPFVVDLASGAEEKPCGAGGWTRLTGGTADADGSFTDLASNLDGVSPVSMTYSGLQFGGDLACFGGHYNGWDLAFGGIAGFNQANTDSNSFNLNTGVLENIIETDVMQRYAGVYMTAARGRFFADLQYRYELTDYETDNFQQSPGVGLTGFTDSEYSNTGQTLSGALGYSWQVGPNPGMSFVASAGFSFSRNETDDVNLGADGVLSFEDGETQVGFVSATLANTRILPDDVSLLSYFGTATYYNDFADERIATVTPTGGTARNLSLENLGSYTELSLGVNYLRLLSPGEAGNARQLNAAIRLDGRFGSDVESYGITGQLRLQF